MSLEARALHKEPARTKPERAVQADCEKWLDDLGALVNRSNAGTFQAGDGRYIRGAKKGTGDLTACLPDGRYCEVECKAPGRGQTAAQHQRQADVTARGGVYLVADSKEALRASLVAALGLAVVEGWEAAARERKREERQAKAHLRLRPEKRPGYKRPGQAPAQE